MTSLRYGILMAGLGLCVLAGSGCTRHVHHHHDGPDVVVLDREHDDPTVVIIRERPGRDRSCWRHRDHWHCRKR